MRIALEYYEPKDLIGKSVYSTNGEKVGEVEKAVFLKDGKGALILKHTDRIILMETVRSVADIILVAQTEATTQTQAEETHPKTSESLVESAPPIQTEQARSQPPRFTSADSASPIEKLSRSAFIEALKAIAHEHSQVSAKNAALSSLLESDPYKALNELLAYLAESFIPHEEMEENSAFPVIVQRQPSKEPLVRELSKEHEWINDNCMQLRRNIGSGRILESKKLAQDVLSYVNDHYRREESLFQQVLKEYSST